MPGIEVQRVLDLDADADPEKVTLLLKNLSLTERHHDGALHLMDPLAEAS